VSDIAFLLIIFFILTTSIRRLTGFTTELPAGDKAQGQLVEKTPTVAMRDGAILFDDTQVSMGELQRKLEELKLAGKSEPGRLILLEAGKDVSYQDYYEVMASVSAAGGIVGLLTEGEGEKK
jgi:biopolymer transport protein ExbD